MAESMRERRHLELTVSYNTRDIGGYLTSNGRQTRWRTLLRSDSMHRLSAESQAELLDYGIRSVIDLRTSRELQAAPNVFAGSQDVAYSHCNMLGDGPDLQPPEVLDRVQRMVWVYKRILDEGQAPIGVALKALALPGGLPAIYHCAGGQDRTGLLTALLLGIAGVSEETIAEDYTLTAQYAVNAYTGEDAPPDVDPAAYTVDAYRARNCPPEVMLGTIEYLDQRYGGAQGYAELTGLDSELMERLRSAITE